VSSLIIDLLRHGEPVGGPRYRGQTDDPLSGRGWLQMHRALGETPPWDAVITSPLHRCRAFAERFAARHALPLRVVHGLTEIDFGRWEGLTAASLMRREAAALARFWRDPVSYTPHGGETLTDFTRRTVAAWQTLLAAPPGRHLLLVSHGGTIRVLLHHVLDIPLLKLHQVEVPYACRTRLHVDFADGVAAVRLVSHGDAA